MDDDSSPRGIPCVIPAAGRSSRMGGWKPLLPWAGGTVLDAAIGAALAAGCLPVLVAGYRADELRDRYGARRDLLLVRNDDWEAGMLGSVRLGAAEAQRSCRGDRPGFLVLPADMPLVAGADVAAVRDEGLRRASAGMESRALFAARGERLGHPVWIPFAFLPAIMGLDPAARLREHLLSGPWDRVAAGSDSIFVDLDTPDEYRIAAEGARGG